MRFTKIHKICKPIWLGRKTRRQNKMKITVTMELTQENLSKLRALLPDTEIPGQVSMFDSPSEKPVEPIAEAPAPAVETPKTEDKPITKTDIRAVALKLSKAGKQKELADIFAKFGCKKLSDFDSRTEDYPALMKELVSVNG
ncbi:MAG: hypothetical protein [Bacteriophage sp.]|nr:MAG: hypothetical protein [Bacteriophage sp.]